jgi:hypothetical protein
VASDADYFRTLTRLSWTTTQQQLLSIPAVVVPPYATQSFGNGARKVDERYTPSLSSNGALKYSHF